MPSPPPPADRREALLAAALELFAERGPAAPVSAIARRAGVAQGLLYRYFPSKDALLAAIVERGLDRVETSLRSALDGDGAGGSGTAGSAAPDPHAAVERLALAAARAVRDEPELWGLLHGLRHLGARTEEEAGTDGSAGGTAGHAATIAAATARTEALVLPPLRDLLAELDHSDPEAAARALFAAVDGLAQRAGRDPGFPLARAARALADAFAGRARGGAP